MSKGGRVYSATQQEKREVNCDEWCAEPLRGLLKATTGFRGPRARKPNIGKADGRELVCKGREKAEPFARCEQEAHGQSLEGVVQC